jgi:hypothetical protein
MLPAATKGFSNLFFGVFVLAAAVLAVRKWPWAFYMVGLLCCLVRPDGILFVGSACIVRWVWLSGLAAGSGASLSGFRKDVAPALVAVMLGAGYFAWRWTYFDEILPLPLVVKSSCEVRLLLLCKSGGMIGVVAHYGLLGSLALVFFLACRRRDEWPVGLSIFVSLCTIPLGVYAMLSLEQNIAHRFFYPSYLAAVVLVALGGASWKPSWKPGNRLAWAACFGLVLFVPWLSNKTLLNWQRAAEPVC